MTMTGAILTVIAAILITISVALGHPLTMWESLFWVWAAVFWSASAWVQERR